MTNSLSKQNLMAESFEERLALRQQEKPREKENSEEEKKKIHLKEYTFQLGKVLLNWKNHILINLKLSFLMKRTWHVRTLMNQKVL